MRLEVLRSLAHADDRRHAVTQGGDRLRGDERVVLVVVLPPLGVTDDDVAALEGREEGARYLAGVRAAVVRREILPTVGEVELVGGDERLHAAQIGEGREDRHLHLC